jgi:hypothetical protein
MLGRGWEIRPPVYVRPRWSTREFATNTYHFVVWTEDEVSIASVPECPEIRQFMAARKLAVDRL